jgi:hypothetical protein
MTNIAFKAGGREMGETSFGVRVLDSGTVAVRLVPDRCRNVVDPTTALLQVGPISVAKTGAVRSNHDAGRSDPGWDILPRQVAPT